jgi:GNAT superfamily N-acetyltransferase
MALVIEEVGTEHLGEYAGVSIAFEVRSVLEVRPVKGGFGGLSLTEKKVTRPYLKDYDSYQAGGPENWPGRFDLANWGILIGRSAGRAVCGATVAFDTPGVHMLGGRRDLSVLWDIRVAPEKRHSGMGTRIFEYAAEWSRTRGAASMKIETQNINVPACRFYLKQGCKLGEIDRYAYAADPLVAHEAMLIWYLDL